MDRRSLLKTFAAWGAAPLTASQSASGNSDAVLDARIPRTESGNLVEPPGFDFPLVLPLPFAHGVASGDPLADRIILWTRITETTPSAKAVRVRWEVSTTPDFASILKSGTQHAIAARDWTVKVDVTGLAPATTYYYRFRAFGRSSIVGRTRTAPAATVENLRFAVVACSSYWASTWSGYGHIADRNDLDLVIHCGDYIYDFTPPASQIVRSRRDISDLRHPDNRDWLTFAELRRRYALFRSDPNLIRTHQQHPFFICWDNHDIDHAFQSELEPVEGVETAVTLDQGCQAFWEWTPSRPPLADGSGGFLLVNDGSYPEPPDRRLLWRKLPYGTLADVFGVDTQIGMPIHAQTLDASHLDGAPSLMGRPQFEWFTRELLASQQTGVSWKVVNNQTWIAPISIPDVIEGVGVPAVLPQLVTRWATYREERAALFRHLRGENPAATRIRGTVMVSGDVHGNLNSDLVENNALLGGYVSGPPTPNPRGGSTPENQLAGITRGLTAGLGPVSGRAASVGVEFAPSSMGNGGADEVIDRVSPDIPFAAQVAATRALELAIATANKNVQFIEWVDHGYGIVDLTAERAIFEHWWQDKATPGSPDVLGHQAVTWAAEDAAATPPRHPDQIDSVSLHGLTVAPTSGPRASPPAPLDQPLNPR